MFVHQLKAVIDLLKAFVDRALEILKLCVQPLKTFINLLETVIHRFLQLFLPFPQLVYLVLQEIKATFEILGCWNDIGDQQINGALIYQQLLRSAFGLFVFLPFLVGHDCRS